MERRVLRNRMLFLLFEKVWIVIGAGAVGAAFGDGFGSFHHEGAAGFAIADE